MNKRNDNTASVKWKKKKKTEKQAIENKQQEKVVNKTFYVNPLGFFSSFSFISVDTKG